jgi:hypothetical protein
MFHTLCARPFMKTLLFVTVTLLAVPGVARAQTPPDKFLGLELGADKVLADYGQIRSYFDHLATETPRLKVVEIGETTLEKKQFMAVITSERNMARLDRYRQIVRQLRDARGVTPEAAAALAKEGKVIIGIQCNIHSTEIASSQMSMELAYRLVTGQTPFDAATVLDDVIFLLVPSQNPDGQQMVTEWYRKYVNTPYEGGRMPWLYHHYSGHDDNRDFYMFNLAETRNIANVLYRDWIPQVYIDEHQMGSTGARFFIAPYAEPFMEEVHPLVWRSIQLMGTDMMYALDRAGMKGVVSGERYTAWMTGATEDSNWPHNIVAFLTEGASARVATPIFIDPGELSADLTRPRTNFINPWPGGWWRLRDLMDYELTFSLAAIRTAAEHREDFLLDFYAMNKAGVDPTGPDEPYAYVISADQHDYLTTLKMLDAMMIGGIEVHRASESFLADQRRYPAGSFVVLMSQPYRPYVKALLGPQKYPEMHQYPGGPPVPPYDNAAWTLPMLMGVDLQLVRQRFEAKLEKLTAVPYPTLTPPAGTPGWLVLDDSENAAYAVALGLLRDHVEVSRALGPVSAGDRSLPTGSFIVKNDAAAQKALPALSAKWHVPAIGLASVQNVRMAPVRNPRIGVYQSWGGNMDEGWFRYLLDSWDIPFLTLHNSDIKEAKAAGGLQSKVDVLVFASEDPTFIVNGGPEPGTPAASRFQSLPPDYAGGIGKEGVEAVKAFVESGGIVLTLAEACEFAFKELGVPARDAVQGVSREDFWCPTSLLRITVDTESPLGFGMPAETAAMYSDSVPIETFLPPSVEWERHVAARFAADDLLMSGWLIGGERIARKGAVVDITHGKGHVILVGIRAQYRNQSHGTHKFLLNALLYPQGR